MTALVCLIVSATSAFAPADVPGTIEIRVPDGPHPRVFLTPDEAEAVRTRAESQDWARAIKAMIIKKADALMARTIDIPHKGGQWSHWYTCKKDGGKLKATSPTTHVCSICGEVYTGWPYDEVYVSQQHSSWLKGIETLGAAYLLDPKPAYAERAKAILLEYASFYRDLELHDVKGGTRKSGARLRAQTLDESVFMCSIVLGYDLLYNAPCFSAEDHKAIEEGFLRPTVETVLRHKAGKSNWQSWHNAAIASVGLLLGDKEYLDFAINDPKHGFLNQMRESVLESGMWYEGAPSYHWYALSALVYLLEGAARSGMDLYSIPVVRGLFNGPQRQLFPDRTFPAMQDSGRSSISGARRYYEVAYRRYEEPTYAALMQPRDSVWALLWGVEETPAAAAAPQLVLPSSNEESEGLAILRDTAGATALFLDYSQMFGGHIQPCRLNLILYAHGDERFVDPGRLPYGNPMHSGWYRQTLAHNTVLVNESGQKHAPGELVAFRADKDWAIVRAACSKAYEGVMLDRTVFLRDTIAVDVFRCTAGKDAVFDLPLHFRGTLNDLPASDPMEKLSDKAGYKELKEVKRLTAPVKSFSVDTGKGTRILVQIFDASEAFTAKGYGKTPSELLPMLLRRQQGRTADFVAVYQMLGPDGKAETPEVTLGKTIQVTAGGASITVGDATGVSIDGKECFAQSHSDAQK